MTAPGGGVRCAVLGNGPIGSEASLFKMNMASCLKRAVLIRPEYYLLGRIQGLEGNSPR